MDRLGAQLCLKDLSEKARRLAKSDDEIAAYDRRVGAGARAADRDVRRQMLDVLHVPLDDDGRRRLVAREYAETTAMLAVQEAMGPRSSTRFLLLVGGARSASRSVGTGKTLAAAHALLAYGGGVYVEHRDLPHLRASYQRDDRERWRLIRESTCVVVDELGLVDPRLVEAASTALFDVVNYRQSRPKLTIMIGNVSGADVPRVLDERARSRMGASMRVVDCSGRDLRARQERGR